MAQLSAIQVKTLQNAGVAPVAIKAYQNGTAAPGIKRQIESVLNSNQVGTNPFSSQSRFTVSPNNNSAGSQAPQGPSASQLNAAAGPLWQGLDKTGTIWDNPNMMDQLIQGGALSGGMNAGVGNPTQLGASSSRDLWSPSSGYSYPPSGYNPSSSAASPNPWGQGNPWAGSGGTIPDRKGLNTGGGGYQSPDLTIPGLPPAPDIPTYDPLPAFPNLPDLQIPQIVLRDYMPQATDAMNAAYAPLFAGLVESRANTQQQGDRSQAMVGGAYDSAIKTMAENAAANQQSNQQNISDRGTQGAQLAQTVGQNYTGNNADVAKTLQSLGIEAAAPTVLGTAANEASWQQGQAQQETQNQQDYLTNQGAADQKYATDMQDTTANAKAVASGDIANQVAQNLFSLDQLKSGYDSEKVKQAISMAMGLTSQDLEVQKSNASNSVTAQQQALDNTLKAYEAQVLASNTSNDQKQQAFDDSNKIRQQAIENSQWEKTFNQTDAKNYLDSLAQQLDSTGSSGTTKPPAIEGIRQYYGNTYGNDGLLAVDAATELLQQYKNPDHPNDPQSFPQFQERVRYELTQKGIDLSLADRVAIEVFNAANVPTGLASSSSGG